MTRARFASLLATAVIAFVGALGFAIAGDAAHPVAVAIGCACSAVTVARVLFAMERAI